MLQKMSFIQKMSLFEYSVKKIILSDLDKFNEFEKASKKEIVRIYLSQIMDVSKKKGFIDKSTYDLWIGLMNLRNSLVHNNGISSETVSYKYPEITIDVSKDNMIQGNLLTFGLLIKWLLNESKSWILNIK